MTKSKLTKYIVIKDGAFRKGQIITLFEDEAVSPEYLQPFIEAPTDTEENGDWIDGLVKKILKIQSTYIEQEYIDNLKSILSQYVKPVEQKLVPLDIEAIKNNLQDWSWKDEYDIWHVQEEGLYKELSKYGVKESNLVPLDVTDEFLENLSYCFMSGSSEQNKKNAKKFLSKYGVPKQEDIYSTNPFVGVGGVGAGTKDIDLTTTTPQATSVKRCGQNHCIDPITEEVLCGKECFEATSVIDVEEVVEKIDKIVLNYCTWVDGEKAGLFSKEDIKAILSSLPIQKKRTIEEVEKYRNLDYLENEVKYTIQFLQDNGLLAD